MIRLKGISKTFKTRNNEVKALNDFNFHFEKGKFYSIKGPSGSGKSTLLNIISLLMDFDTGKYLLNNNDISKLRDKESSKYRNSFFGFVVQDYELLESETVLFNVELPAYIGNHKKNEVRKKSIMLLEFLGISDQKDKKVMNLSGGQKQRVAIARSMINNPKVILADEPTGALDYENGLQVIKTFKEIAKKEDITIIMVTHNIEFAEMADEVLTLKDGYLI